MRFNTINDNHDDEDEDEDDDADDDGDDNDIDDGLYGRIFTMAMGPNIRYGEAKFYPRLYYNLEEIVIGLEKEFAECRTWPLSVFFSISGKHSHSEAGSTRTHPLLPNVLQGTHKL